MLVLRPSKIPFGAFRRFLAACCAHSLCAVGAQLAHLQPDKYFPPGTCPGGKCFSLCFPLTRKILRSFFDTLGTSTVRAGPGFFDLKPEGNQRRGCKCDVGYCRKVILKNVNNPLRLHEDICMQLEDLL